MVESKTSPTKLCIYAHTIHNGIFTYIWLIFMVNVGEYSIHGSYGLSLSILLVVSCGSLIMVYYDTNLSGKYCPCQYTLNNHLFFIADLVVLQTHSIHGTGIFANNPLTLILQIPFMDPVNIYKSKGIQHLFKSAGW